MIDSFSLTGPQSGPKALFFGGIHGNEPAGTLALQRVIEEVKDGLIEIVHGKLTIIAACNPQAANSKARFIDINLNRVFEPHVAPTAYEHHLANQLIPYVNDCDCLIDLHTVTAPSDPFCFLDHMTVKNVQLVRIINTPHIVTGWGDLYFDTTDVSTQDYAHRIGKSAVTIECGQHQDPESPERAYHYIKNILAGLGMIEKLAQDVLPSTSSIYHLEQVIYKTEGLQLSQEFKNFQLIAKDDLLAESKDRRITSLFNGAIVMPNPNVNIDEDMFYLAKVSSLPV